jgi:hypothetical protein
VAVRVVHAPAVAAESIPDYCGVLAQPEADLLQGMSPPEPLHSTTITLGRESVLSQPGKPQLFVAAR